ncbi:unnamed protein product [Caenorhabditis angaria]|uniref:BHLH domain-containing protein n=1 Tax=Caenorhabditis angaria TaxID=860376 RepID=A0A9P1IZL1_9PELO|nr:unnamed protein product [Caenorhabditis angaria]
MEQQQINIGTLLSAARLLESSSTDAKLFNEEELRSLFCGGKMKSIASTSTSIPSSSPYSPPSKKTSKHSRAAHNELEKNRRANLRGCLEQLKTLVPTVTDAARNTTLALLTRARDHIIELSTANEELRKEKLKKDIERSNLLAELAALQSAAPSEESSPASPTSEDTQSQASSSRPESRSSPYYLEYSPSSKPSMTESPKPILIDPIAEGLLPVFPLTYPRPSFYPQNVLDLLQLQAKFLPLRV